MPNLREVCVDARSETEAWVILRSKVAGTRAGAPPAVVEVLHSAKVRPEAAASGWSWPALGGRAEERTQRSGSMSNL